MVSDAYKRHSKKFEDGMELAIENFEFYLRRARAFGYGEHFEKIKKKLVGLYEDFKDIEPFNKKDAQDNSHENNSPNSKKEEVEAISKLPSGDAKGCGKDKDGVKCGEIYGEDEAGKLVWYCNECVETNKEVRKCKR